MAAFCDKKEGADYKLNRLPAVNNSFLWGGHGKGTGIPLHLSISLTECKYPAFQKRYFLL